MAGSHEWHCVSLGAEPEATVNEAKLWYKIKIYTVSADNVLKHHNINNPEPNSS